MFWKIILIDEGLQLLNRAVVVLFWTVDKTQGQSIAGGVRFLVVAELAKKFAEAVRGEGIVFLVVCPARAVQQHVGGLRLRLRGKRSQPRQNDQRGKDC